MFKFDTIKTDRQFVGRIVVCGRRIGFQRRPFVEKACHRRGFQPRPAGFERRLGNVSQQDQHDSHFAEYHQLGQRGSIAAVTANKTADLIYRLDRLARHAELDFAGIATHDGRLLCRIGPNTTIRDGAGPENPIIRLALERQAPVDGSVVLTGDMLERENPALALRARIPLRASETGNRSLADNETSGMAMAAAVPIFEGNTVIAVLYGGQLLNRSETLVDSVRDTVFPR